MVFLFVFLQCVSALLSRLERVHMKLQRFHILVQTTVRSMHKDIRQSELEGEVSLSSGSVMTLLTAIPLSLLQRNTGHSVCILPLSHGRRQDLLGAGGCGIGLGGGGERTEYLPTIFCYIIVTVILMLLPLYFGDRRGLVNTVSY
jgi:hypothetical protein